MPTAGQKSPPPIFQGIFGILCCIAKFLVIYLFLCPHDLTRNNPRVPPKPDLEAMRYREHVEHLVSMTYATLYTHKHIHTHTHTHVYVYIYIYIVQIWLKEPLLTLNIIIR